MTAAESPRACVIGWPIAHSRSPLIHRHWLETYGIAGSYTREAVRPEELAGFLGDLGKRGYVGCNVTIPHKEAAFALAAVEDAVTRRIGAVNTLYLAGQRLIGLNTDGFGFLANLSSTLPGWSARGQHVTILGAGGAARAIVAALLADGAHSVTLINRTEERGLALARQFGPQVSAAGWHALPAYLPRTGLLVNTTSLGMAGHAPLLLDLDGLPRSSPVADIVYVPLETELLKHAGARGHPVIEGLGMLLYQAVPGFEKWFGQRPEVTPELRALVAADIQRR